ncbi:tRNA (adenosine(37)-N6)-threonylcarbamoyltransferase complex ATPase subunit type 1 TsaE [Sphingorhabdus sp. Alg239-R122]|uniref:tRNA (adenosine(37)-N6)-threonylcarbamoyltransferase complex ATPase subunit type 1 TsaE n=1 Tax=Sphingorhabdus sp. Alg239-R122 TaxID=2305989 RepID=UPI001F07F500|nr:tRNA (adenosine(37)-N6)-threonylcarbamoyltransferase complex ATPase subunit type 1 TsaE [Sphingorhabdus sp. Alg239-R122]
MKRHVKDAGEMQAFGQKLGEALQVGDVIKLHGELGTGKTTMARGILLGLGHSGEVPSPSFSIVQYYAPPDTRIPTVHADFYRIENSAELYELGLDDATVDGVIIVEWPEKAAHLLGENALAIHIDFAEQGGRYLNVKMNENWTDRLT